MNYQELFYFTAQIFTLQNGQSLYKKKKKKEKEKKCTYL